MMTIEASTLAYSSSKPTMHNQRKQGVAMLLVLFAVVIATVLSVTFLSAQSTTHGISQNIQHHTRARFIADSASQMIIKHLMTSENWRDEFVEGTWMSDQALAGGSFTIVGEDGLFDEESAAVDGDGDLSDDAADPVTLTITGYFQGRSHRIRAAVTPALIEGESGGGNPHGASVTSDIEMKGNARIDGFDSSTGTYSPSSNSSTPASIATNVTGSGKVKLENSAIIVGNVSVGTGANVNSVISYSGSADITGDTTALPEPIVIPSIPSAGSLPSSLGSYTSPNSGSATISTGFYRYSSYTVKNNYTINISGDVTLYVDGKFEMDNAGKLQLNAGATLIVYANEFVFKNNGKFNMTSPPTPANAFLYQMGSSDLTIDNSAHVAAQVLAPTTKLLVKNNGRLFGTFQGKQLQLENSGRFTQDLALSSGGGGGGGSASGDTVILTVTWTE